MYFINRSTWKLSQRSIVIIVMTSFMRSPFMSVFHQSKCISTIKRILFYYHVCILVFFHVLVCSLLLLCVLRSIALRAGMKILYSTISERGPGHKKLRNSVEVHAILFTV